MRNLRTFHPLAAAVVVNTALVVVHPVVVHLAATPSHRQELADQLSPRVAVALKLRGDAILV
jgi:hypothetical protein